MNKAVFPGGYPYVYSHYGFMQEYKKQPWLWLFGLYWGSPSVIIGILKLPVMSFPIQLIGSSCWGLQFEAYRLKVPCCGDIMCQFKFPSKISRQHFNATNLVTNQALAGWCFLLFNGHSSLLHFIMPLWAINPRFSKICFSHLVKLWWKKSLGHTSSFRLAHIEIWVA